MKCLCFHRNSKECVSFFNFNQNCFLKIVCGFCNDLKKSGEEKQVEMRQNFHATKRKFLLSGEGLLSMALGCTCLALGIGIVLGGTAAQGLIWDICPAQFTCLQQNLLSVPPSPSPDCLCLTQHLSPGFDIYEWGTPAGSLRPCPILSNSPTFSVLHPETCLTKLYQAFSFGCPIMFPYMSLALLLNNISHNRPRL